VQRNCEHDDEVKAETKVVVTLLQCSKPRSDTATHVLWRWMLRVLLGCRKMRCKFAPVAHSEDGIGSRVAHLRHCESTVCAGQDSSGAHAFQASSARPTSMQQRSKDPIRPPLAESNNISKCFLRLADRAARAHSWSFHRSARRRKCGRLPSGRTT
jgi:hypothetical protein